MWYFLACAQLWGCQIYLGLLLTVAIPVSVFWTPLSVWKMISSSSRPSDAEKPHSTYRHHWHLQTHWPPKPHQSAVKYCWDNISCGSHCIYCTETSCGTHICGLQGKSTQPLVWWGRSHLQMSCLNIQTIFTVMQSRKTQQQETLRCLQVCLCFSISNYARAVAEEH